MIGFDADAFIRELDETVAEIKRELGHGNHEGWRSEDGIATVYCGCGAEIYSMPQRYVVGIDQPTADFPLSPTDTAQLDG